MKIDNVTVAKCNKTNERPENNCTEVIETPLGFDFDAEEQI